MSEHKEAGILRLLVENRPEMLPVLWNTMLNLLHEAGFQPYRALTTEGMVLTAIHQKDMGIMLSLFEEDTLSVLNFASQVATAIENQEHQNG